MDMQAVAQEAVEAAAATNKSQFDVFVHKWQHVPSDQMHTTMPAMYEKQQRFGVGWNMITLVGGLLVALHAGFAVAVWREQFAPPGTIATLKNYMSFYPLVFLGIFVISDRNIGLKKQVEQLLFPSEFCTNMAIHVPWFDEQIKCIKFMQLRRKHLGGLCFTIGGCILGWFLGKYWWQERLDYIKELKMQKDKWKLQKCIKVGQNEYDEFDCFLSVKHAADEENAHLGASLG